MALYSFTDSPEKLWKSRLADFNRRTLGCAESKGKNGQMN